MHCQVRTLKILEGATSRKALERRMGRVPVTWWFFAFCRQAFYVLALGLHSLKRKLEGYTKAIGDGPALRRTQPEHISSARYL
jgi:hypothetical protein